VPDDLYEAKVVVTRGSGTNDRDKFTMKVAADDMETLNERVELVRERVEKWAEDFRAIQPASDRRRRLKDDQSQLEDVEA
jgi:hypothetical protein